MITYKIFRYGCAATGGFLIGILSVELARWLSHLVPAPAISALAGGWIGGAFWCGMRLFLDPPQD